MKRRTQIIKIGVVGGGPSGLAAAWQLSRKFLAAETLRTLPLDSRDRVEIHVFEKRPSIGPSIPWATDVEPKVARVHTIHFFASSIMLDPAEPDAFIRWALGEEEKCTCAGSCDPERRLQFSRSFPSRATVGQFFARQAQLLRDTLEDHIQSKNSSKFHIKLIEHTQVEVTNIHTPNMIEYRSLTAPGTESPTKTSSRRLSEPFSYLIIATGHIPSRSTAASAFLKVASPEAKSKYIDQLFPISAFYSFEWQNRIFANNELICSVPGPNRSRGHCRNYWISFDGRRCCASTQSERSYWPNSLGFSHRHSTRNLSQE
jgi:hypothetical protein